MSDGEAVIAAALAPSAPAPARRISRRRRPGPDAQALSEDIIVAGTDWVTPRCAHFDYCGGCALQQLESGAQLRLKELRLQATLARLAGAAPAHWLPAIRGPVWGYRRRARLGVRFVRRKQRALVGFRERHSNLIADLRRCEVLAPPADGLIMPLCALVAQLSIRERLPQIEVAVADNAVALVLRVLEAPSADDLACLRAFETLHGVHLYLQPGGIDSIVALTEPAPRLFYALPHADLELEFLPSDFVQVNASVNRELVAASAQLLQLNADSSLLDLYCGLGNFSLALARRARRVVGVEGDVGLVARARDNARRNGIEDGLGTNVNFFHLDCLASEVRLNVDLDVTLTVIANGCYHWLAHQLKGFEQAKPKQLYRKFIETGGQVEVAPNQRLVVTFDRRSHNPILREAALDRDCPPIPWLKNYRVEFAYR